MKRNLALVWQALLFLILLLSLIGTSIEVELLLRREISYLREHLVRAVLWPGGVAITLLLARGNRRAMAVTALRVFFGLLVVGGLTRPGLAGFSTAAIAGIALYVLVRYVNLTSDAVIGE